MRGFQFHARSKESDKRSVFEKLLEVFLEILVYTNGDVEEAFEWLRQIDTEHRISTPEYSLEDFRRDLENQMIVIPSRSKEPAKLGSKGEQLIRQKALLQIFGSLKPDSKGSHSTRKIGSGGPLSEDLRPYQFGDNIENIDFITSFRNAQKRNPGSDFEMREEDLEVFQSEHQTRMSTVLMIDVSHSMILYGEDRITPAKKVAMALTEWIAREHPMDTLDVIAFGNDAWPISPSELPYLSVGPFHTNTVAGLELAMDILRKRKTQNKQILMITDGKPTCIKLHNGQYYMNSAGHDPKIIHRTMELARQCRKLGIRITTFMIARDPWLQQFVEEFTEANQGSAFYSGLQGLGDFIFSDYKRSKKGKR